MTASKDVRRINADEMVDGIQSQIQGHHDTLYCSRHQASKLQQKVSTPGLSPTSVDNFRLFGLDVQALPVDFPIVCQRGEVFDLAKDYKNGEV